MAMQTISWAAKVLSADYTGDDAPFFKAETDSRKVKEGMLYVPLPGARVDGHDFALQAQAAGAAAMLWRRDRPRPEGLNTPLILVDDTQKALEALGHAWLEEISPLTIGITGSNGKTSTKDFTASVFSQKYKTWKTQGNRNSEVGLPLTILEADADTEVLILEMGMENPGEIELLCQIAPLDMAIVVSIGLAHLENLGSQKNIAKAKCEILTGLKKDGVFIYRQDQPHLQEVLDELEAAGQMDPSWKMIPFGPDTPFCAEVDEQFTIQGLRFALPGFETPFTVHAAGEFQAHNATAAAAAGLAAGLEKESIVSGIDQAQISRMRGQILPCKNAVLLDDTYKSNPEAAAGALATLMKMPAKKHAALLADMLDLGEDSDMLHAQIGTLAADLGVDLVYTFGKQSRHTAEAFGGGARHFETKQELIEAARQLLEEDCAILIKGSRSMAMDEVTQALLQEGMENQS